ncbi:MAG: carboxypeptidase-like regulatory domain-containing protein [Bacteroidota bacterium]|nr:carboxypeptidase-like regulatory domain-containing protein [Bacteroidota bacterium]
MTEKNKTYNATDFERYHNGSMPASEMYALEKAALEDPFLADALEGYAYSSSVANDLAELRSRLPEKAKRKNVVPLFSFRENGWWRIAALLAIIAGASYFFFQMNYGNSDHNTLAVKRQQDSGHQKDNTAVFADTSKNNNLAFDQNAAPKAEQKKVPGKKSSKEKETYLADANYKPSQPLASAKVLRDKFNDSSRDGIVSNEYRKQAARQYSLKGKVTDEKGKPLAFATIKDENKNKAAVSDTAGNFSLYSNDSSVNATVSALGYASKEIALKENEEPVIAVDKNEAALSEVVVTAYGTRKKKNLTETASVSKQLNGKINGLEINPVVNNSKKFDKYLEENTTPLFDENNIQINGEVILSFTVNEKGRPRDIAIIKSSCKSCEEEAIKLLKNGPDWKVEENTRQNALIKF